MNVYGNRGAATVELHQMPWCWFAHLLTARGASASLIGPNPVATLYAAAGRFVEGELLATGELPAEPDHWAREDAAAQSTRKLAEIRGLLEQWDTAQIIDPVTLIAAIQGVVK